jgi:hypothetical protein
MNLLILPVICRDVSIATRIGLEDRRIEVRFLAGITILFFSTASRPTLGLPRCPIKSI